MRNVGGQGVRHDMSVCGHEGVKRTGKSNSATNTTQHLLNK